jgi:hypothetical protein
VWEVLASKARRLERRRIGEPIDPAARLKLELSVESDRQIGKLRAGKQS